MPPIVGTQQLPVASVAGLAIGIERKSSGLASGLGVMPVHAAEAR